MDDDGSMVAISRFLFIGPVVIVLAWFLAGQWGLAGPETRAWLQFASVVCLASLLPLPGAPQSLSELSARVQWLGWVVVAGLVATT
jgi:hypothetical protein